MLPLLLVFTAAFGLALALTPLARLAALRTGTVDAPAGRKAHTGPIPLLGGAAIYLAFLVALLAFGDRYNVHQLVGIMVGATLVSFLGVWDDRRPLRPLLKLAGQVVAALLLVAGGVQVEFLRQPVLNVLVTVLWVVGITNALNLLDNMDGVSGGVAAVAAASFCVLAALSGQYFVGSLAAALGGACLGFLRYNFNPARIFMGDSGSLFIGFVLAAVGIKLRFANTDMVTWMVPVLVLGLPIFDTTLVTVSRLRRGRNPLTTPGRDHLSHRLVARGLTPRQAVLALYVGGAMLGLAALLVSRATVVGGYTMGAAVALAGALALWELERQWPRSREAGA